MLVNTQKQFPQRMNEGKRLDLQDEVVSSAHKHRTQLYMQGRNKCLYAHLIQFYILYTNILSACKEAAYGCQNKFIFLM